MKTGVMTGAAKIDKGAFIGKGLYEGGLNKRNCGGGRTAILSTSRREERKCKVIVKGARRAAK